MGEIGDDSPRGCGVLVVDQMRVVRMVMWCAMVCSHCPCPRLAHVDIRMGGGGQQHGGCGGGR